MRSPKFIFILALLAVSLVMTAIASAAGATPPPETGVGSPFADHQPGLVADGLTPLVDGAREGDAPEPPASGAGGVGGCQNADACWLDGVGTQQWFTNCVIGGTGYVYTYVGYWGKDDFSYPQVGDRYWGHIVSGVVGSACGGEFIGTDVELPAQTQFDLDNTPEGKIRCFYTSGKTGNTEEITDNPNADCKQNPGAGVHGGWGLGGRTIPAYGTFEVIFPIRSTKENLGTSKLRAALDTAISSPDVAYPEAVVAVTPRATDPDPDPDPDPHPDPDPDPDPNPTPRATPLSAKLAPAGTKLSVTGMVTSDRSGDSLGATLYRSAKKGKPFRKIASASGSVGSTGGYALSFKRPSGGKCKATVTIGADPATGYEAATKTVTGKC